MTAPGAPVPPMSSLGRLVATLGGLGAFAGLLIVAVFAVTEPRIRANKAAALAAAINEVLGAPDRYDTLYLTDTGLATTPPGGLTADQAEAVYLGWRGEREIGFALVAAGPGFQDRIRLLVGYDPATSRLLGMKVLESKETPGLGDKIIKDTAFVSQFQRVEAPLEGVKEGRGRGAAHEIVVITGATISSRAVVNAINAALDRTGPMLDAYRPAGGR